MQNLFYLHNKWHSVFAHTHLTPHTVHSLLVSFLKILNHSSRNSDMTLLTANIA